MSLTNPEKVITEERLSQFYGSILPYLGGMPEAIANKFSKGDLYSTDEKMIGQWVDGKPLYQKSVNFGALPNKTSKTVAHGISNIDTVVKIDTIASRSSYNTWVELPIVNDTNINYQCGMQVVGDNLYAESRNVDFSSFSAYVTIQYTKTTDSAISIGNDTDYSTTEKIVGTWIDGKPLYQKTVTGLSVALEDRSIVNALDITGMNVAKILLCTLYNDTRVFSAIGSLSGNTLQVYAPLCGGNTVNAITIQYTKTTD